MYAPALSVSAIFRVRMIEAGTGVPCGPLVAVGGEAACVLEHSSDVEEVPGRERRVPLREVVLRSSGPLVEIARTRSRLADPPGVRLRRDHVTQVLQRVQDVH